MSIVCWISATILAAFAVGKFSTKAPFVPTMMIVGLVYIAPATIGLIQAH